MHLKHLRPLAAKDMKLPAIEIALLYITKAFAALMLAWALSIPTAVFGLWGFCALDFLSGVAVAYRWHILSSVEAKDGLIRKVAICLTPLIFHSAEKFLGHEVGAESYAATMLGLSEVISIVENMAYLGVPIPSNVVNALAAAKKLVPRGLNAAEVASALSDRKHESLAAKDSETKESE